MAKAKKEIANANSQVLAKQPDYIKDEGTRGQENVGIEDLTIPRLGLIQDLSPQRKKNDPKYIDGATEGMLFNNVTNSLYGTKVMFVPVYMRKEWVIWKKQAAGGGFEGAFNSEAEAITEFEAQNYDADTFKKDGVTMCSHEIVDMGQHFGMIVHDDGSTEDIVLSFSKSKMKIHRQFNTLIKLAGGDRFSRVYEISAVPDENKEGQDFYNFAVGVMGFVTEPVYRQAEKLYDAISEGAKDVDRGDD